MGGFRRESSTFLKILSLVDELRILLLSVSYFHAVPENSERAGMGTFSERLAG